mgnify:CR=1 FL=1
MRITQCFLNCAYNLDRAAASLFGADPQATISSESGRHNAFPYKALAAVLNELEEGHVEKAQANAAVLKEAMLGKRVA